LELHILALKIVILDIQQRGFVRRVKDGPFNLDLDRTFEFISRNLFIKPDKNVAFDPLFHGVVVFGPSPVVDKIVHVGLHGVKQVAVRSLNPFSRYADVTPEFLTVYREQQDNHPQRKIKISLHIQDLHG